MGYLAAFIGAMVFYAFYREWFSWFFLVGVALLPWLSLLLSLPAMLTVKVEVRCPEKVRQDMPARSMLRVSGPLPAPPVRCNMRLVNSLTDERFVGQPGEFIPTTHCGMMTVTYPQVMVFDYLGLFRRKLPSPEPKTLYIEPRPVATNQILRPESKTVTLWRPKAGGGFSENHDLRLYRPGDDLRHIHWKMVAKTGKLIYREPMEPAQQGYALNLTLSGTPEELDTKLGKLVWTSRILLQKGMEHTVRCMMSRGVATFTVHDDLSLERCLHRILRGPCATERVIDRVDGALWQQEIGGDSP